MIVADKFVYIHMHKTGGQTLSQILLSRMRGAQEVGYHYPVSLLPVSLSALPVIGMVRNPWDWYVSWYAFNTRPEIKNPVFLILSDGYQSDFTQTVTNLITLGDDSDRARQYRRALADVLPDNLQGNIGVGLSKSCMTTLGESGKGYFTWLFNRMHGNLDRASTHIGRFENLEADFLQLVQQCGVGEEELASLQQGFAETSPRNTSRHSHYSCYFDDTLRDLVAARDADIIARYDYAFENQRAQSPTEPLNRRSFDGATDDFVKMGGEPVNYLRLHDSIDVTPILDVLGGIEPQTWSQSGREARYEVHQDTSSLLLVHDADYRHFEPTYHPLYEKFAPALAPILSMISERHGGEGFIGRVLIAKLRAGGRILTHADHVYSLIKCNRHHVPLITNEHAVFTIGGEDKVMRQGEMWEINNATTHSVYNGGDEDRIHLIVDWVPSKTVRPQDRVKPQQESQQSAAKTGDNEKAEKVEWENVGRNQLCPCQSGKRYKHCHGQSA
ncbi:MAG: aspartyl/asparaginyl beta-hydroxylase domain-containing protein [Halioglobus sp.]